MWAEAPESRYHLLAVPDEDGPAVALWSAACSDCMSHAGDGAVDELAPGDP